MGKFVFWVGVAVVAALLIALLLNPDETRWKLTRTSRMLWHKLTSGDEPVCPRCQRADQLEKERTDFPLDQEHGYDQSVWATQVSYLCPHCYHTWSREEEVVPDRSEDS